MESHTLFRTLVGAYGAVLGIASLWILSAELSAPGVLALPTSRGAAANAALHRGDAIRAAQIGLVRGDLWAKAAFTYADLANGADAQAVDQAASSATHAVRLMPGNSAAWLMLAALGARYGNQVANAIEAVKMSYYTGPQESALTLFRLNIAARLNVTADPELERLFRHDIETILTDQANLQPAVASAYATATPAAQRIIEETAKRVAPAFAQTLHPGTNHQ